MSRLHALLRLRDREQRRADAVLAEAAQTVHDKQQRLDALRRGDTAVSPTPRPTSLPQLLAMRMEGVATREQIALAADDVALSARDEIDARAARSAAATRRRSVERAIERRDQAAQAAARRAAARSLHELARLRRLQP